MLSDISYTPATSLHSNIHENVTFTSEQHVDEPISKLHHDVLWRIFMINAVLGPERAASECALTITRFTSQVCRQWRELVLNSPSIWANIIDLHLLQQPSDDWRCEVMRRTGKAPLSIRGRVQSSPDISRSFFFFLLDNSWERIRRLEVTISISADPQNWKSLRRPAPALEVLRMSFRRTMKPSSLTSQDQDDFLSGHAPLLQEFHCPGLTFSPFAPWIPQLRSITMSYPSSISDIFSVLANTPVLESLEIKPCLQIQADAPVDPSRKIELPRLNLIDLTDCFRICLLILKRVVPSPRCVLNLSTDNSDLTDVTSGDIRALQVILSHYSDRYFNFTPNTTLILHISPNAFSIAGTTLPTFRTTICSIIDMPRDNFPAFLASFFSCNFSSVTTFRFAIFHEYESFQSDIIRFISLLPAVEIINATKNVIRILLDLHHEGRYIFPSLHTLTLEYGEVINSSTLPPYPDILLSYLALRRNAGFPIKLLDLKLCSFDGMGNLEFLEQITGLKVLWRKENASEEYICGSGSPQILDL